MGSAGTANPWHWVIDEPNLTPTEKLVAITIIRHQSGERPAWPSVARIAELTKHSIRSIQYTLRKLERKGALTRWGASGGRGRTAFYRMEQKQALLFSAANAVWKTCAKTCAVQEKGAITDTISPERVQWVAPGSPGSTEARKKDSALARGGLTHEWRQQQKARRILGEIDALREVYAGAHGDAIVRREYKLRLLYAELEKTGWQDARAG